MTLVSSVSGPKKKNSEGESPDFDSLWVQLNGLSALLVEFSKELGDKAPQATSSWIEDVYEGVVDPEKDWKTELDSLPRGSTLKEKIYEHYLAANRQLCYFERLYNKNRTIELHRLELNEKNEVLRDLSAKLAMCIAWGYWHYHVSLSTHVIQKKKGREKGANAARDKAAFRDDSITVLRTLIRGKLNVRPPGGWSYSYDAAKKIAASVEPVLNEFEIDIPERGKNLAHRINLMIESDSTLKRIYKENR